MTDVPSAPHPNPKAVWLAEIRRVAAAHRWGVAIVAVGWLHLAFFLACQSLSWFLPDPRPRWPYPMLWFAEVITLYFMMNRICGRRWAGGSPVGLVVVRVWGTYLILAFGLSTLNSFSGWEHDWFKPVWGTLGTFGFATMAWLFNFWFLVPAFQMYFTSLLMVKFPEHAFLIHGLSWWLAMNVMGVIVTRRLRPVHHGTHDPIRVALAPLPPPPRAVPSGPVGVVFQAERPGSGT